MFRYKWILLLCLVALPVQADEPIDWEMVTQIRSEGLNRSEVMETLAYLTDTIGSRLTGSPGMQEANEWTRDKMAEWGLENAHLDEFGPFGRGWTFSRAAVHMTAPHEFTLQALPKAWTPGTDGSVRGRAIKLEIESEEDMEKWRGQLAGKILFVDDPAEMDYSDDPTIHRRSDHDLKEMAQFEIRGERRGRGDWRSRFRKRLEMRDKIADFLVEEGVVATVSASSFEGGIVRVTSGGTREPDKNPGVTALVMAAEQYNWILRLLPDVKPEKKKDSESGEGDSADDESDAEDAMSEDEKFPVELEIEVAAKFHGGNEMAYNTIAEIPGTEEGVVLLGAHLDSWHAGTGATDNAAGCAVMMEAVRILQKVGVKPKRTIRVALWSAEEQGLIGSKAYVEKHLAKLPIPEDAKGMPGWLQRPVGEVETFPAHDDFSVYFNLDNGSGKIRGVYAEENAAAAQIFKAWLEPFHDLDANTVTLRQTGGTDHRSFDAVGLPGFQFIQDRLDYGSRTHHTNVDVYDRAIREDLIQASVVVATFAYHAAMRDERFPRKAMPVYEPRN